MPQWRYNRYRDVEIDISKLVFANETEFLQVIEQEHAKWYRKLKYPRIQDMAVMWLNVPKEYIRVVPWLMAMTPPFVMHHANSERIMLVRQANVRSRQCQIPSYGTHYVKVECVVIEETTGRILMVRERLGTESVLKLVTGAAEAGEFVSTAAEREVWEEARVRCTTVGMVGCGNRIRTHFDRDEIIIGILLFAPVGQNPRGDGFEVREAMWCDVAVASVHCSQMSKEWIAAAAAAPYTPKINTTDKFRGAPHTMDFFVPRPPS